MLLHKEVIIRHVIFIWDVIIGIIFTMFTNLWRCIPVETSYKGTNKMITGIVFGVITFWLFAQSMVNVVPAVQ